MVGMWNFCPRSSFHCDPVTSLRGQVRLGSAPAPPPATYSPPSLVVSALGSGPGVVVGKIFWYGTFVDGARRNGNGFVRTAGAFVVGSVGPGSR